MKYFEFLEAFAKVAHEFKEVEGGDMDDGPILRAGKHCPITKVYQQLTGKDIRSDFVDDAAKALNLDFPLAQEIADSSDWYGPHKSARTRRDLEQLIEKCKMIRGTKGK